MELEKELPGAQRTSKVGQRAWSKEQLKEPRMCMKDRWKDKPVANNKGKRNGDRRIIYCLGQLLRTDYSRGSQHSLTSNISII